MTTRKHPSAFTKQTLHEGVTEKIVRELKTGTPPWVKPWHCSAMLGVPRNYVTNRAYTGINVLLTWLSTWDGGFRDTRWLTANQISQLGGTFRGQSATRIVFAKAHTRHPGTEKEETYYVQKLYNIFNAEQVSGIELESEEKLEPFANRTPALDAFIAAQGVPIKHGGDRAFYNLARDAVALPFPSSFVSAEAYYAVALHELVHATGHPNRLARKMGKQGSYEYFVEELIAELGAAFVCAEFGLTCVHHAGYIGAWINLLEADAKVVFTAAREASRAADYLRATAAKKPLTAAA